MPSYTQDQITKAGKAGSQNSIHGWGEKKGHNDDLDAFRHAFTWANLTKAYGPVVANALGRLNELNSEDELETKMDLHNNAVGIAVAQRTPQEDIAKTVAHATKAGITINDPYNGKLTDPTRPDVTSFLDSRDLFDFENQLSAENAAPAFDHDIAKAPDNPTPGVSSNTGNGMFGEDYGPNVSAEADTPDGGHDGTSGSADTSSAGNYGDGQDWSGVDFGGWGFPVVLDLGDDGIEIVTLDDSTARFDIDGDGRQQLLAWVGPEDALLVYDRDGDRLISHKDEIAFRDYLETAKTDLEGLRWFDQLRNGGNEDGVLDHRDAAWGDFGIWQDADQDGETGPGELQMTNEGGLKSVNLTSGQQPREAGPDARVFGKGDFEYAGPDGKVQSGDLYDTALRYLDNDTSYELPRLIRLDGQPLTAAEIMYPDMAYDETIHTRWPDRAIARAIHLYPDLPKRYVVTMPAGM